MERMPPLYYRLDRTLKVAVPCEIWEAAASFSENRVIKQEKLPGGLFVSTVFLMIDHNYFDDGPPLLFETLVFDDYEEGEMRRYSTWAEAEQGHDEVVARLQVKADELARRIL